MPEANLGTLFIVHMKSVRRRFELRALAEAVKPFHTSKPWLLVCFECPSSSPTVKELTSSKIQFHCHLLSEDFLTPLDGY